MSNPERAQPKATAGRDRSTTGELTGVCSQCECALDPLRAARVRILDDRFHYFCSAVCATEYEPRERSTPHPSPTQEARRKSDPAEARRKSEPGEVRRTSETNLELLAVNTNAAEAPAGPAAESRVESTMPARSETASTPPPRRSAPAATRAYLGASSGSAVSNGNVLLLQVSVAAATLCILLLLALEGPVTSWLRLGLAVVAGLLQAAYLWLSARGSRLPEARTSPLQFVPAVTGLVTAGAAAYGLLIDDRDQGLVSLAGTQQLLWGLSLLWIATFESPLEAARQNLLPALDRDVLRVTGDQTLPTSPDSLRPGEDIVIHAGELLPVDASIVAGSGEVHPWLSSDSVREVGAGDLVYAGARLVSGQVRAVVRWTGYDRHWLRLTLDPSRRADRHAPSVLLADRLLTRIAPAVVLLVAAVSWSQGQDSLTILSYALATAAVLTGPALPKLVRLEVLRSALETLNHGIVVASAAVLETAGRVTRAVFCARGTLLLGEPQLSTLEPLGTLSNDEILALVAGAEQSSSHPIASSVLRAARAASILPDAVRNPRSEPGLGVTALASDGRALVVGSRALMLRERVSVARAEARITELEATGRTVLLVALGGHLSAILSFQDGLRKGARAAVQHLLDAAIEPVLLSGDARETCEALAKTLDIEHVRPDVLPADRGKEVERLRGGGAGVAVVGRSPTDDLPLASATVSIALPSQGLQAAGFDIDLASDEVHKASLALRLLHEHRSRLQRLFWVLFGGGLVTVLGGVALGVPAAWLPFVSVCGLGALRLFGAVGQRATAQIPGGSTPA